MKDIVIFCRKISLNVSTKLLLHMKHPQITEIVIEKLAAGLGKHRENTGNLK